VNAGASSASGSGGSLRLSLATSFKPAYAGARNLVAFAGDTSGLNSAWEILGTWTVPATPIPDTLTMQVSPNSGGGGSATFVVSANDSRGFAAVNQAALLIGNSIGAPESCYIDYYPPTKLVSLRNDDGTAWIQGTLGSSSILRNDQCAVYLGAAGVTGAGNVLRLSLPVSFSSDYAGSKYLYLFGADQYGQVASEVAGQNQSLGNPRLRV
jgi:large repetitive protein